MVAHGAYSQRTQSAENASERKAIGLDEKVVGNFIFLKYQWAKQDFERPPRWELQPNQLFSHIQPLID